MDSGVGDGQGGLVYCGLWGLKELDKTERLNWTELGLFTHHFYVVRIDILNLQMWKLMLGESKSFTQKSSLQVSNSSRIWTQESQPPTPIIIMGVDYEWIKFFILYICMLLLLLSHFCHVRLWSHRWQPTRLPRPWDSPAKNTGVGCHFLLQCMKVKSENKLLKLCQTLQDPMDCSLPGSSVHGIFQARVLECAAIAFSGIYK